MLEKKILDDYKDAMKKRDAAKSSALSFLRSSLMNVAIEKSKKELDDIEVITVIRKQINKCQDSIEQFKKGDRQDLVSKETQELEILKAYLPQQLDPKALEKIIDDVIKTTSASSIKDMGRVIKEVVAKAVGQADNKIISELVRGKLTAQWGTNTNPGQ